MPKSAPYTASNGFAVSIDQHTLLASPDARGLLASVLAVVERDAVNPGQPAPHHDAGLREPGKARRRRDLGLGWP